MSYYYWDNREDILKNAHDKYHNRGVKEKAKKDYQANKEEIKEKEKMKYQFMPENEKEKIEQRSLRRHYKMKNKKSK